MEKKKEKVSKIKQLSDRNYIIFDESKNKIAEMTDGEIIVEEKVGA